MTRLDFIVAFLSVAITVNAVVCFADEDQDDSQEDQPVFVDKDAIGRYKDISGEHWDYGADGVFRSESGQQCKHSEALDTFICNR